MLKTCSRPAHVEKSGESVQEISTPGNLSRISRNPRKSETYRIRDRPLKKAEAMGQGVTGGRRGLHLNCQQRPPRSLLRSPTLLLLLCPSALLLLLLSVVLLICTTLLHCAARSIVKLCTVLLHIVFYSVTRADIALLSATHGLELQ